eukprot:3930729-Rhodomonas_salina.5
MVVRCCFLGYKRSYVQVGGGACSDRLGQYDSNQDGVLDLEEFRTMVASFTVCSRPETLRIQTQNDL